MKNFNQYIKENSYNGKVDFKMNCGTEVCVEFKNVTIHIEKQIKGLNYAVKNEVFHASIDGKNFQRMMERAEFLYLSKTAFFANPCGNDLVENNN